MFKGFYTSTSGMITQNRNLNVISNNMANVSTPGYKSNRFIEGSFMNEIISRTGNKNKGNSTEIGEAEMMTVGLQTAIDFEQGGYEQTDSNFDFCIEGNGFFRIQNGDKTVMTRNGSFTLDNEGYLSLPNFGRVLDVNQNPIKLDTDEFNVDRSGSVFVNNVFVAKIGVFDFPNYNNVRITGEGFFTSPDEVILSGSAMTQKVLERSNVSVTREMQNLITAQRTLQSSAQLLRMYDTLMAKITTDIGRV